MGFHPKHNIQTKALLNTVSQKFLKEKEWLLWMEKKVYC